MFIFKNNYLQIRQQHYKTFALHKMSASRTESEALARGVAMLNS